MRSVAKDEIPESPGEQHYEFASFYVDDYQIYTHLAKLIKK